MTEWLGKFLGITQLVIIGAKNLKPGSLTSMCISKHCAHRLLHWLLHSSNEVTSVECTEILPVTQ